LLLSDVDNMSIKGASCILDLKLLKKFSIPSTPLKLNELALHDSYLSMKNFLLDSNTCRKKSSRIIELKPAHDKVCFDYGLLLPSGIDGKSFAVFFEMKSGRQYPDVSTDITGNEPAILCEEKDYDFEDFPKSGK